MNLVIDVGNTRTKYACFDDNKMLCVGYREEDIVQTMREFKSQGYSIYVLLSGSNYLSGAILDDIRLEAFWFYEFDSLIDLPIKLAYLKRCELGRDRIADCVGALTMFCNIPLLVIDCGTCITYNYMDDNRCFLGGSIAPGLNMRFRSLHEYTAALPLVEPIVFDDNFKSYDNVGNSTEKAIQIGVMQGVVYEINGYINDFIIKNPTGKVVITGGSVHSFVNELDYVAVYIGELGLIGLNAILNFSLC